MAIELNVTQLDGMAMAPRTPNESLISAVGTGRTFETVEDAIDSVVGVYANPLEVMSTEQRFGVVQQFVGVNPFSSFHRF